MRQAIEPSEAGVGQLYRRGDGTAGLKFRFRNLSLQILYLHHAHASSNKAKPSKCYSCNHFIGNPYRCPRISAEEFNHAMQAHQSRRYRQGESHLQRHVPSVNAYAVEFVSCRQGSLKCGYLCR